jgi:hypothetical protein
VLQDKSCKTKIEFEKQKLEEARYIGIILTFSVSLNFQRSLNSLLMSFESKRQ